MICSRFAVRSLRAAQMAAATTIPLRDAVRAFLVGPLFGWFLFGFQPFGVKHSGLIDPFVSVRAEEIALGLQEIRGQASRAIAVEVSQRRRKRGGSYAVFDTGR